MPSQANVPNKRVKPLNDGEAKQENEAVHTNETQQTPNDSGILDGSRPSSKQKAFQTEMFISNEI